MAKRVVSRVRSSRKRSSEFSSVSDGGMFESRPFIVQSKVGEEGEKSGLKTSLMQAERYGHHPSQIKPVDVSVPATVQVNAKPQGSGILSTSMGEGVIQQKRHRKKLTPAAEINRQRLLKKQRNRAEKQGRILGAEKAFHEMLNTDGIGLDQHKFPFDNFNQSEPVPKAMDRLPATMRRSNSLREMMQLPDAAHGQQEKRQQVKKGEFQEALAGWSFAKERGLKNVESHSATIDFVGEDAAGKKIPFDPFMSPLAGSGQQLNQGQMDKWAQNNNQGSYYKHTHSKGGNKNTVGVWDKTYTSAREEGELKKKLNTTGANKNANVHALRVPIAREFAREHVMAEDQIEKDKKKKAEELEQFKKAEARRRKNQAKARRRKRKRDREQGS